MSEDESNAIARSVLVGLLVAGPWAARRHCGGSFQTPATPDAQDPPAGRIGAIDPIRQIRWLPVSTGELVDMLDTYAIVQAQAELTLNDAQYGTVRHRG